MRAPFLTGLALGAALLLLPLAALGDPPGRAAPRPLFPARKVNICHPEPLISTNKEFIP